MRTTKRPYDSVTNVLYVPKTVKVRNCTMNQREEQYQNLNNFTQKIHREIMDAVSSLGWSTKSIETDNDNRLLCPYNSSHRIGKKILDRHLESCQWKEEGYNEFDIQLPESCSIPNSYSSLKLDSAMQNSILLAAKRTDSNMKIGLGERLIPRTSDRIFTDFTSDERRVLYDYVVSNTVKPDIGHDITDMQKLEIQDRVDKKLSFLELLIQERNLKRRRAKHKGVHTNKKSHTEILREVIHQQMELYMDHVAEARTSDHNTKAMVPSEDQNIDENYDDGKNAIVSPNEFPSKRRTFIVRDSSEFCETSNSRDCGKYKSHDRSYSSNTKNSEHRSRGSRLTEESWQVQKPCKRKRSRSRERERDSRKSENDSTRTYYKRKESKQKRKSNY